MKHFFIIIACALFSNILHAQLYINSDITIQNNAAVYADDTVQLGSSSAVTTNGILQSTKSVNTNGYLINTGSTGFIISPVPSGAAKTFDIGTSSNNKMQIQHTTGSAVIFQLAVRDNVYLNPVTSATQVTTNVVNKTWYVAPQSSVSNLSGTAFWNATDEATGFLRSNCGVSYWQSGTSTSWSFTNGTSGATVTGSTPAYSKTASTSGLTAGIYYFGVGGFGSSLPVTLLSFDAAKMGNDVHLKWVTSMELNSDHFEIERSVNSNQSSAISWENIATIKGAGNSNIEMRYEFNDISPFIKLNSTKLFYRIKLVDEDGTFRYSEIKEVEYINPALNSAGNFLINTYPNPDKELLNIDIESTSSNNISVTLFDNNGRVLLNGNYSIVKGNQMYQLNTSQFSPGIYLLNIVDENGSSILRQKLIIN